MQIKIGTEWIYNTDTKEGSKVIRDSYGNVTEFETAFTLDVVIQKGRESRYESERRPDQHNVKLGEITKTPIPLGVIKKAIDMQIKELNGELDDLQVEAGSSIRKQG